MVSPLQRPLPDNTQHSQQTNIHAPGGIRTHNLSRRAAVDLRLRPRGHWDRLRHYIIWLSYFIYSFFHTLFLPVLSFFNLSLPHVSFLFNPHVILLFCIPRLLINQPGKLKIIKIALLCHVIPCILVEIYRRLRGFCCLHQQCTGVLIIP